MKQLLILSGKGGTGKTTVASSFIRLSEAKAFADCDVDAPNLHLISSDMEMDERRPYYGMPKGVIDEERCTGCGRCSELCRFGAVRKVDGRYAIEPMSCEGCGVCQEFCPEDAVYMKDIQAGDLMLMRSRGRIFSTAKLRMGNGTSGMLVSEVKGQMRDEAPADTDIAVIDGSPGIGCPVVSSMSGVDMVLIVAEPSLSGMNDMKRVLETAHHFGTKTAVCVNKYDTNPVLTDRIEAFCREEDIPFAGRISFDPDAVRAINSGRAVVDTDCRAGGEIRDIYEKVRGFLEMK